MVHPSSGDDTLAMRRFDELSDDERVEKTQRLAQKALVGYGLAGDLAFVVRRENTVFRLRTGGGSYAVRICAAGHDHVPLQRELTWLAALGRDTTLAVPEPVLTLTGELFRSVSMEGVPGTRACAVLRWIDGERREAELTTDEAAALGRYVGLLHRHAEEFRWPEELIPGYVDPATRALAVAEAVRSALTSDDDRSALCSAVEAIAAATASLGDAADDVGIIHGDLRLRRLRHGPEGIGAFGFDECRVGDYLDDLSVLWAELGDREATPALQQALLDGYRSIRELPASLETSLRAFAMLRALEEVACDVDVPHRTRKSEPNAKARAAGVLGRFLTSQG